MTPLDRSGVASSTQSVRDDQHADMRVQVVRRELEQGVLSGFGSQVADQGALLVIAALDSYDADALRLAYEAGYRDGFQTGDRNGRMRA